MVRLTHPNGVVVNVPAGKAERLLAEGWKKPSANKAGKGTASAGKKSD